MPVEETGCFNNNCGRYVGERKCSKIKVTIEKPKEDSRDLWVHPWNSIELVKANIMKNEGHNDVSKVVLVHDGKQLRNDNMENN